MKQFVDIETMPQISALKRMIDPIRERLLHHGVYGSIQSLEGLRRFTEYHVFAVWDFMSLLKALQRHLTCVEIPWQPKGNPLVRRFVNDLVLAEESDEIPDLGYLSHFELYLLAMKECGSDTETIENFLKSISEGMTVYQVLDECDLPDSIRSFVGTTWNIVESGEIHKIAAAFTFGREDLIPEMFKKIIERLRVQYPNHLNLLTKYLERHIDLDGSSHSLLAYQILAHACGNDGKKWDEAATSAMEVLKAREELWDEIYLSEAKTLTD